jgi:hypothetical protein
MPLELNFLKDGKLIKYICIGFLRRYCNESATNLLFEFLDNTYVCPSNNFAHLAECIKTNCIQPLQKDMKIEDEKLRVKNFIYFLKTETQILEDKLASNDTINFYDLLSNLTQNIEAERNRIYEKSNADNNELKLSILECLNEIVDALIEFKDDKDVYYYLD